MPLANLCRLLAVGGLVACFLPAASEAGPIQTQAPQQLDETQIERLIRQLNDDDANLRDDAETKLLDLAPVDDVEQCVAFLRLLPRPLEGMPDEVKLRLKRIRSEIETRQAEQTFAASRVTLPDESINLDEAFTAIQNTMLMIPITTITSR